MNDSDTNTSSETEETVPEQSAASSGSTGSEALQAEIASLKDKLLRALAEAENIRRRGEREREDVGKFAISKFAQNLLPVADNLRRAIEAVSPESSNNDLLVKLLNGVEATERSLLDAFEKAGIKTIETVDQAFNPNFHEVMAEIDFPDKQPGTIVQLFETGYMIQDRLLRPARVAIAKGASRDRINTSA